ncbi:hypothetical protein CWO91_11125 [Bradyrhizobium genosp. SA-3]|nr:hypothetical protein CWO91_11125 [Bradyrhizobium genosp. SA-3]
MTPAQPLLLSNPGETEFILAAADWMMTDSPPKKKQRQSSPDKLSDDYNALISEIAEALRRLHPQVSWLPAMSSQVQRLVQGLQNIPD